MWSTFSHTDEMNFYLSAVDEQLRHSDNLPSIGIILCKGCNEVIVESALRDTAMPMSLSQYQVSAALPAQLADELPTLEELSCEYPALAVASLRIEFERLLLAFFRKSSNRVSGLIRHHPVVARTSATKYIVAEYR